MLQVLLEGEFTRELSVRDITRVFRLFRAISRLFRVISRLFRAITRLFRAISPHISRLFRDYFGLFRNNFACGCTNYFASGFPLARNLKWLVMLIPIESIWTLPFL